ncbi:MAG: hypothetical protein J6578_00045 [Snodgrassella sp.]|uniref:Uncharacterized protein n=1 Tax=Snodgrassella alvi TaxID=1196083 RepID=A0A2N9XI68_9NEIS|nr:MULTISPECIES: hypothetical protein [Snodgrassella]MCO6507175.1 hypothetical protein [Snodgrassella sp.]MCO6519363.1 hypothetical protein [Snodgrassella sp.]PIT21924.1 hypothetical protein BGI36_04875 [Snodgrassella communis]PIT48023.1 hypothetical protein BHC48_09780 [Snodgrassella communis]
MLIEIGFGGGSDVFELGTANDIILFFECIEYYVVPKYPERDWILITDRFYRRYLRLEELDTAEELIKLIEEEFKQYANEAIDITTIRLGKIKSCLNIDGNTLFDIFNRYFKAFYECVESAKLSYENFGSPSKDEYLPVMICITTIPYLISYKQIPLTVFDDLESDEEPIWLSGKIPT